MEFNSGNKGVVYAFLKCKYMYCLFFIDLRSKKRFLTQKNVQRQIL
jgi:hypothetical protein